MKLPRKVKAVSVGRWPSNPYPGLRPFLVTEESDESLIFFGRQSQIFQLVDRLRDTHFMAVLGPSGCGKSSLVRAGLMPGLSSGLIFSAGPNWGFAELEPGRQPVRNLATALASALKSNKRPGSRKRPLTTAAIETKLRTRTAALVDLARDLPDLIGDNKNLFILVDQFEEIFGHDLECDNEDAHFINLLLNVFNAKPQGLYVVITMRTDFLEQCATFHGLPEALNKSQYLTPRLNAQQLEDAIKKPLALRHFNGDIEPQLVRKILSEMTSMSGYDPDFLPLMQHALFWLWRTAARKRRKAGAPIVLKLDDYDRLAGDGGLQGVLSQRADQIFDERLNRKQQLVAARMFQLLSDIDENGRRRRRVTTVHEVADLANITPSEVKKIANKFAHPNVSFVRWKDNKASIDVTHESLIRKWERCDAWSLSERSDAEDYLDFERAAQKWRADQGATLAEAQISRWEQLLQGKPDAELWAKRYGEHFSDVSEFVSVSRDQANRAKKEEEERERLRYESVLAEEKAKRSRIAAGVLGVLSCAAIVGWMFAWSNSRTAEESAKVARTASTLSEAARKESEEKSKQLTQALAASRDVSRRFQNELVQRRALSDVALKAIALRRASIVESEVDEGRPATALRLALDARKISTKARVPYNLALARAATAAPRPGPEFLGKFGNLISAQWTSSGWSALWSNGAMQESSAYDAIQLPFRASPYEEFVPGAYLARARLALVTKSDGSARIMSGSEESTALDLGDTGNSFKRGTFSTDGKFLVTLDRERSLRIWNVTSGKGAPPLLNVDFFALSADNSRLVTASKSVSNDTEVNETFVRLWKLNERALAEGGEIQAEYSSHVKLDQLVKSLDFGAGGTSVFAGLGNGEVHVLNELMSSNGTSVLKQDQSRVFKVFGKASAEEGNEIRGLDVSHDGKLIAIASSGGKLRVADVGPTYLTWGLDEDLGRRNASEVRFGPDGNKVLVSYLDHAQVYDLTADAEPLNVESDGRPVALSPNGERVLTTSHSGPVKIWDASTGKAIAVVSKKVTDAVVTSGTFSPDGSYLALGYNDGAIEVADPATGQNITVLKGKGRVTSIAFDPNSGKLLSYMSWKTQSGKRRRSLQVWDVLTGYVIADFSRLKYVRRAGFSPDGRWLHVQDSPGSVLVWDLESRRQVQKIETNTDERISAMVFAMAAGRPADLADLRLAVSSGPITRIWDVATGRPLFTTDRHSNRARSLAISSDASLLMAAFSKEVRIWRLQKAVSGKPLKLVGRADGKNIRLAIFDPDSQANFLVFSGGSGFGRGLTNMAYWTSTRLSWFRPRGEQLEYRTKRRSEVFGIIRNREQAIAWQAAHGLKALSFYSKRVRTWRMERKTQDRSLSKESFAIEMDTPYWADFTADGGLVVFSTDGLSRYEPSEGEHLPWTDVWAGLDHLKKGADGFGAEMSPGRKLIVAPTNNNAAIVVDAKTGELIKKLEAHSGAVNSARFNHRGDRIMTTSADGTVRLWQLDLSTGLVEQIRSFDHKKAHSQERTAARGDGAAKSIKNIVSGAFHSSGDYLVTASDDGLVSVWNTSDDSRPLDRHVLKGARTIWAIGFTESVDCVFFESGTGKIEFRDMRELKSPCIDWTNQPPQGKLYIEGFRLLHYRHGGDGDMAVLTGMSDQASFLALYSRKGTYPLAVWKDPIGRFAGWANWSPDRKFIAVPFGRGKVRVLRRPSLETWDELLEYAEQAAKPSISKEDRKRLQLTDIKELLKLVN